MVDVVTIARAAFEACSALDSPAAHWSDLTVQQKADIADRARQALSLGFTGALSEPVANLFVAVCRATANALEGRKAAAAAALTAPQNSETASPSPG